MPVVLAAASRGLKAFRDAFSARAVLVGCLGSVLLVLGSLTPAYLPRVSPLTRAMASYGLAGVEWTWIGTVITMAGLALMLEFWLRVRPARRESRGQPQLRHWAVLAIVAAPMLVAPPIFSHDAYSYAAQGWLLNNNLNPYLVGPGILPGQFADQVAHVFGGDIRHPVGSSVLRLCDACCCLRCGFCRFIRLRFVASNKQGKEGKAQGEEQRFADSIGGFGCHAKPLNVDYFGKSTCCYVGFVLHFGETVRFCYSLVKRLSGLFRRIRGKACRASLLCFRGAASTALLW